MYSHRMGLLLDSFWRSVAYCLHPRVIGLSVLPLIMMVLLSFGLGYFFWDSATAGLREYLGTYPWFPVLTDWLGALWASTWMCSSNGLPPFFCWHW
jgi:hypothetical protein